MKNNCFIDPDLHTPAHDSIMIWLQDNSLNVVSTIEEKLKWYDNYRKEAFDDINKNKPFNIKDDFYLLIDAKKANIEIKNTEWERPYKRYQYGSIYYIDMLISAHVKVPKVVSLYLEGKWFNEASVVTVPLKIACEVKPVIRSVGELIRQLRNYESSDWRVALVSPYDRFKEIIEQQGFFFIKAPQPDYGPQSGLF